MESKSGRKKDCKHFKINILKYKVIETSYIVYKMKYINVTNSLYCLVLLNTVLF